LPGYSVLYPPLAALAGATGVGIASVLAALWTSLRLAPPAGVRRTLFIASAAVLLLQSLVIGQVPFLLGVAFGVPAVALLLERRRWFVVAVLAALCSLASPLAGALLLLIAPACATVVGVRAAVALLGAALGPAVAFVVGGAGGPYPMPWQLFVSLVGFCLLILFLAPREQRALRVLALCYLAAGVLAFVVPNPVGGNLTRLGKLIALPLACHYVSKQSTRRQVATVLASALAVLWPTAPFLGSVAHGADDPSRLAGYFSAPISFLKAHLAPGARVEIPFTREHWEAYYVARRVPLARGWERQTDYLYNSELYHPLSAAAYRQWLADNSVEYVALPDVPIDVGGVAEQRILQSDPSYLAPAWRDAHWTVWRVRDSTTLVSGAAVLRDYDPASVSIEFTRPGDALVRVHYSNLWHSTTGSVCITPSPQGWLTVHAAEPGLVELGTDLDGVLAAQHECTDR
jgi:MFS family permease